MVHLAAVTPKLAVLPPPLRVERQTRVPGMVRFDPSDAHRVRVHAGPPVPARCGPSRFVYTRGDLDLLPFDVSDAWEEEQPAASVLVHLAPALVDEVAGELGGGRVGLRPRFQVRDRRVEHIVWALDAEHEAGSPSGSLFSEGLGLALAAHLLGHYRAPVSDSRGLLARPRLRRVLEHIDAHLARDLSLVELARVAGLGASHFKAEFKRATGLPVHAYVVRRRVERARQLLERNSASVGEVALEVGFAHQSHLAHWMRRLTGSSPTQLRAKRG